MCVCDTGMLCSCSVDSQKVIIVRDKHSACSSCVIELLGVASSDQPSCLGGCASIPRC